MNKKEDKRVDRREFFRGAGSTMMGVAALFSARIDAESSASEDGTSVERGFPRTYVNNKAPLRPMAFVKLPIGCFEPGGWVRIALERQRDGMVGHLGEISAWLVKENNAWLSPEGKGENGWEEVPYWLRGYSRIGYLLNDRAMIKESSFWIDALLASQREDGEFGPSHRNAKGWPEAWSYMLMLHVLQSWYEYSKDPRVIPFMRRYFKWQLSVPDEQFLKDYWENSRGADNLLPVYWLYNLTGDRFLLDLATKIDRNTANWRQTGKLPNWHVVNIAQSFREPATYFLQSKNRADLQASYADFKLARELYGQVPGGMFGADENARPGYSDPHQATELDGMIEEILSNGILLGISGDPMWAENTEDIAFNSMPAAFMPDYRALRYLTAPNMVLSDSKNHAPGVDNKGPFFVMNPLSHRCCQHNSGSAWANFVEYSWMATPDKGLAAQLYLEGTVRAAVGASGGEVSLQTSTKYPFEDNVEIRVHTPHATKFPLWLRIPSWATGATVQVNGRTEAVEAKPGSYARLSRTWHDGDHVSLRLPMSLRLERWQKNKNSASVNYGPLTFSLKIDEQYEAVDSTKTALSDSRWQKDLDTAKWPAFEIRPLSDWNYGLMLRGEEPKQSFEVVRKTWPPDGYPFTNEGAPIEIKAHGKRIPDWKLDKDGLCGQLPQSPVATEAPATPITLVPMGGARLRISSFPVVG